MVKKYCNNSWQWVVQALNSNEEIGLKSIEIEERKKYYGDNKINLPSGKGIFSCIIREFLKMYIFLYIIISSYLFYKDEKIASLYLFCIVGVILSIKITLTYKREKRISLLQNLNYATVRVVRDGIEKIVKAEELVIGDIIHYSKNSLIPADLRIINCKDIKVDEKNLTGETFFKEKFNTKIQGNINNLSDMKNILFKGSVIKGGEGTGIVVSTGNNTELGKLLTVLNYGNTKKNVFIPRLEKAIGKRIIISTVIAIALYFVTFTVGNAEENLNMSLISIFSIPIMLVVFTYIFYIKNIFKNKLEIINPSVLQLISDVEIIFMDKIGSFSKEEMVVKSIYTNFEIYKDSEANYNKDINVKRLIDILLLCNNSFYNVNDNTGKGTLEEIAFIRFGAFRGAYKSIVDNRNKKLFEVPMDSDKRIITTVTKSKRGCRANMRGSLDEILDRCTYIMVNGLEKEITNEDRERIKAIDYNLSVEGLTTQGIAYRSFSYEPTSSENIESNLVFVGIVALEIPPIDDYKEKIDFLRENDITPIIFTDSNKITATTFGMKIGLIKSQAEVISGIELEALSKEELLEVLGRVKIICRIGVESKSKIVALFAKDNYKILTSGENIGDLPSLSLSTVGVTKGEAPQVIKKVSDAYIKEDYLNGIFSLITYGKEFIFNINESIKLFTMVLFSEIIILSLYSLYGTGTTISYLGMILINSMLVLPLLYLMMSGCYKVSGNRDYVISSVLWSGTTLFSANMAIENSNFYAYITLGACIIIWQLISINKMSKVSIIILVISVIAWIGLILYFISLAQIVITPLQGVSVALIIGIYALIEWIIKKWIVL
ncbi:MAG: cation-transporting P-type ATPase [Clostridium sp.]